MPSSPLTPEMDRWIDERVRAGAFRDRDEALRTAVRLLKREEEQHQAKLERLRTAVQEAWDEFDRGEGEIVEDVSAWLREIGDEVEAEIAAEDAAAVRAAAE